MNISFTTNLFFWLNRKLVLGLLIVMIFGTSQIYAKEGYAQIQGIWQITEISFDIEDIDFTPYISEIEIINDKLFFINPNADLSEFNQLGGIQISLDNQHEDRITVFWFVGIYKMYDDYAELTLKYKGQGVGAKASANWELPSDFIKRLNQDHVHILGFNT